MKKILFLFAFAICTLPTCANGIADRMLVKAIQNDNLLDAKFWLEHGANANYSDDGRPVLSLAMEKDYNRHHSFDKFDNSVALTELLLQHGANPNSNTSLLPLISAVLWVGDYRLCHVLLSYGANPYLVEEYEEVNMNAVDYAKQLGYTRVAQLLVNPKLYSEKYTVVELNYLIKICLNAEKYDETIEYCKQFYKQLPNELSTNYSGWLSKEHIYFYHESALFQKSLIASQAKKYDEAELLILEAIKFEQARKTAGSTEDLGVDLNQALVNVRGYRQDNPASVLDDLELVLKLGSKDSTTVKCLLSAASYLNRIGDTEGRYNCLATAYNWVQQDSGLQKELSKNIYHSLMINCMSIYCPNAKPIVSEDELYVASEYIQKAFGAQSVQAYQYESAKISYYFCNNDIDKAIELNKRLIITLQTQLYSTKYKSTEQESIKELYVLSHLSLSFLYESKYNSGEWYNVSFFEGDTIQELSPEEYLAYNTLKYVLDDSSLNSDLNLCVYTSFLYQCHKLNKLDEIWQYVPIYYKLNKEEIDNAMTALSEEESLFWWNETRPFLYDFDIMIATILHDYPSYIPGEIYNNELFKKDLLLRTNKRLQKYVVESGDSTIAHLYGNVISQKAQLIQLQSQKHLDDSVIVALKKSIQSNERLLASVSNMYSQQQGEKNITWKNIQAKLRANDVAIEFINAGRVDQYWALILRKEYKEPKLIYLENFKRYYPEDVKTQMDFWKNQMDFWKQYGEPLGVEPPEPPQFLQFSGDAGEVYKYGKDENGTKLYDALWKPLTQYINEGDVVYFAPSGVLLQLSMEALPVNDRTVLSDHYKLIRLSSTKEVVIPRDKKTKKEAVLYGNIQYGIDNVEVFIAESEKYQDRSLGKDATYVSEENRASVRPLYGTKIEVDDISKILSKAHFKFRIFESYNANEESFKALSGNSPQILHVATHGFYWNNDRASNEPFVSQTTPQGTTMVDPLMRCGLLFSGANAAYSGHPADVADGVDDGILTAKEISLLDLSNTKLLVLSACETGLGELTDAGVFGLQRAFKQAGVETIIMSLWKVDDKATQMMMSKFYELWLSGQYKRTAFYNAQREIRKIHPKEPYYWAGFIMLD